MMHPRENGVDQAVDDVFGLLMAEPMVGSGSSDQDGGFLALRWEPVMDPSNDGSEPVEILEATREKKKYSCSTCGRLFSWRQNRNTHMRLHTNRMPHSCKGCGKKFKWCSSVKSHRRKCQLFIEKTREDEILEKATVSSEDPRLDELSENATTSSEEQADPLRFSDLSWTSTEWSLEPGYSGQDDSPWESSPDWESRKLETELVLEKPIWAIEECTWNMF
eukprot:CAMPEP_0184685932 /NCGR_PEP_ID=MMETSP0312-20130426/20722_1 /TAXON_ID=31354 /ORGANISM="Compsopogon coeruleus, Strain SAG 36.94" /LENGTH=219 /DNA_ID=CAMNT_0027140529 /DNA_START=170 /DNA_END=829 /DNA_ORIENTATION=+